MAKEYDVIVPDTSIIVSGVLSRMIVSNDKHIKRIVIHEATIAELEHQANTNKTQGILGLEEIKKLQEMKKDHSYSLEFTGLRPHANQIRHSGSGEIDAMIRQAAYDEDALFMTSDKVQYEVALAKGIRAEYVSQETHKPELLLEKYFDEHTMSVH